MVERKNDECIEKMSNGEEIIVQMVRNKFASLIKETKKQKAESSSRAGSEMTSLDEKITLLNNIKLNINKENLSQRDAIDYQETIDSTIKYTNLASPHSFGFFEYKDTKNKEMTVKELCGELLRMDLGLGTVMPEDEPVQRDIFVEPGKHPVRSTDETEKEANITNQRETLPSKFKCEYHN